MNIFEDENAPLTLEIKRMIIDWATEVHRRCLVKMSDIRSVLEYAISEMCYVRGYKFPVTIPINEPSYNVKSIEVIKNGRVFVNKYNGCVKRRVFKSFDLETCRVICMITREYINTKSTEHNETVDIVDTINVDDVDVVKDPTSE